jgi:hypothetical protein
MKGHRRKIMSESTSADETRSHDVKNQGSDPRSEILGRFFVSRMDAFAQWNWERGEWQCVRVNTWPKGLLGAHLKGSPTIATYPVNELGNTPFVAFDVDAKTDEAYQFLGWLRDWFEKRGVLFLMEDTGGRGLHGWVLFLCFVPAAKAVALANLALDYYEKEKSSPLPCPVEIFPKQIKLKKGAVGNCIRLPWGQHKSGDFSHFLKPQPPHEPDDCGAINLILNLASKGKKVSEFDLNKLIPAKVIAKVAKKGQLVPEENRWGDVILEGQRHNTMVSLAGELRARRFSPEKILTELQLHNRQRCRPPLDDGEVEAIARGITEATTGAEKAESQADTLVRIAAGHYLFHDLTGEAYAKYRNKNHSEISKTPQSSSIDIATCCPRLSR